MTTIIALNHSADVQAAVGAMYRSTDYRARAAGSHGFTVGAIYKDAEGALWEKLPTTDAQVPPGCDGPWADPWARVQRSTLVHMSPPVWEFRAHVDMAFPLTFVTDC